MRGVDECQSCGIKLDKAEECQRCGVHGDMMTSHEGPDKKNRCQHCDRAFDEGRVFQKSRR